MEIKEGMGPYDHSRETYAQFLERNVHRQRAIYLDYITDEMSLAQIGKRYGLSSSRIRQISVQQMSRHVRWGKKQKEIGGPWHNVRCPWPSGAGKCSCNYWLLTVHRALGWE